MIKRLKPTSSTVFVALIAAADASERFSSNFIRKSDLPQSDQWVSLNRDVEFLPGSAMDGDASNVDERLDMARRRLASYSGELSPYDAQPFVEGQSEYDEYQQAWRFLGFMIDCDAANYDDDGSWDGGTGEGCARYLMWAAYVDLEYEGGGIGEYQYWDRENEVWDDTSCNYGDNNRCAKMDCHDEDTHWSLLGLFKHYSYDDWMEQLFKHEGFCVWSEEEYNFMSNARQTWPQGCEESETTTSEGYVIYYDLKPIDGGGMTIGLYTDTRCMDEYVGDITPEDVLGNILLEGGSGDSGEDANNYDMDGYSLDDSLALWQSIFDTWKICQPCVAYDLNNVGYNVDDDASRGSAYNSYGYDDDNNGGYDQNDFDCYDDADYTNVNQCMKFMAKTSMNTATFRDLSLASSQGTLVEYLPVAGVNDRDQGPPLRKGVTRFFFFFSLAVLVGGLYMFYIAREKVKNAKDMPKFIREPLVFA